MSAVDSAAALCVEQDDGDTSSAGGVVSKERYAIHRYVSDYVCYRCGINRGEREKPMNGKDERSALVRAVASIFEEKHAEELRNMVAELCLQGRLTSERYVEVVENFACSNESSEQMSYGRLVALIAFAGAVAARLYELGCRNVEISPIIKFTTTFLEQRIAATWSRDKRSWDNFFDLAKTIVKLNDEEKKLRKRLEGKEQEELKAQCNSGWWLSMGTLAFFGILSIGAFTLLRFMLRAR